MELTFLTGNKNKLSEVRQILGPSFSIKNKAIEIEEIQSMCVKKIAIEKAIEAFSIVKNPVFCEDSALYIKLDNGNYFPGPFIKYYFQALGLEKMAQIHAEAQAYIITMVAYHDGKQVHTFVGKVDGYICKEVRGLNGFGVDPIFVPQSSHNPEKLTFAQMEVTTKNLCSHRSLAVEKMKKFLLKAPRS